MNRRIVSALVAVMVSAWAAPALAAESGVLVLREAVSFDAERRAAAAALFTVEFEKYGVAVTAVEGRDVKSAAATVPGARRAFALDVIALGNKLVLKLGEYDPAGGDLVFGESITASGMEELDTVVPRLVKAVLLRKKLEETQTVENLTDQEGRAWRKKFGEFLWGFGINFGGTVNPASKLAYGMSFKVMYEMEHMRVDFFLGGAANYVGAGGVGIFATDLSLNYLFLTSNYSPYVGAGIGFGTIGVDADGFDGVTSGAIGTVSAGLEMFRLYGMRLLVGARMVIPFFKVSSDPWGFGGSSSESRWMPGFLTDVSFVW